MTGFKQVKWFLAIALLAIWEVFTPLVSQAQSLVVIVSPNSGPPGTVFTITTGGGGYEGYAVECTVNGGFVGRFDYYGVYQTYQVPFDAGNGAYYNVYCYQPDVPDSGPLAGSAGFSVSVSDSDGDGIPDPNDACPFVFAQTQNGCPQDSDGDGLPDDQDACPNTFAQTQNGCPQDSDGDGLPDANDACPNTFAQTQNGCPLDSDGDGIADSNDACPNTFAQTQNGCPLDSDGDGIADSNDACPNTFAQTQNGCPLDSDGDGVSDEQDACPNTAAQTQDGCPLPTQTPIPTTRVPATSTPLPDTSLAQATLIDWAGLDACSNLLTQTASLSPVQMIRVVMSDDPCANLTEVLRRARFGGANLPSPLSQPLSAELRCSTDPRPVPSAAFVNLAGVYSDLYGSQRASQMISWVGVSDEELCAAQAGDPFLLAFRKRIVDPLVLMEYYMGACHRVLGYDQMTRALRHLRERRDDDRFIRVLQNLNGAIGKEWKSQIWCAYVQTINRELPPTPENENALLRRLVECRIISNFDLDRTRNLINANYAGYSWSDLNAFLSYFGRRCPSREDYQRFITNGGTFIQQGATTISAEVVPYSPINIGRQALSASPTCPSDDRDLPSPQARELMARIERITDASAGTFGNVFGTSESERVLGFSASLTEDGLCAFMRGDPFGTVNSIRGADNNLRAIWYTSACLGADFSDGDYRVMANLALEHPDFTRVAGQVAFSANQADIWCAFARSMFAPDGDEFILTEEPTVTPLPSLGDPQLDFLLECGFADVSYLELIRSRGFIRLDVDGKLLNVSYDEFINLVRKWRETNPRDCFDIAVLQDYARAVQAGTPSPDITIAVVTETPSPTPELLGDPDWDFLITCGALDASTLRGFIAGTQADGRIVLGDAGIALTFTLEQLRAWAADFRARGVCPTSDDIARFQSGASVSVVLEALTATPAPTDASETPAPISDPDLAYLVECGTLSDGFARQLLFSTRPDGSILIDFGSGSSLLPFTLAQLRAWAAQARAEGRCPSPDDFAAFVSATSRAALSPSAEPSATTPSPETPAPISDPDLAYLVECGTLSANVARDFLRGARPDGRIELSTGTSSSTLPFTLPQLQAWSAEARAAGRCPSPDDFTAFVMGSASAALPFIIEITGDSAAIGDPDWDYLVTCGTLSAAAMRDILNGVQPDGSIVLNASTSALYLPFRLEHLRAWAQAWQSKDACPSPDDFSAFIMGIAAAQPYEVLTPTPVLLWELTPAPTDLTGDPDWDFLITCGTITAPAMRDLINGTRPDGTIVLGANTGTQISVPFTSDQFRRWAQGWRLSGTCPTNADFAAFVENAARNPEFVLLTPEPIELFELTPAPRGAFGDEDWDYLVECNALPADSLRSILSSETVDGTLRLNGIDLPFTQAQLRAWVQNWRAAQPDTCPTPTDFSDFVMSFAGVERVILRSTIALCPSDSREIPTSEMSTLLARMNRIGNNVFDFNQVGSDIFSDGRSRLSFFISLLSESGLCAFMQGDPFGTIAGLRDITPDARYLFWTSTCIGGEILDSVYINGRSTVLNHPTTANAVVNVSRAAGNAEKSRLWCAHVNGILSNQGLNSLSPQAREVASYMLQCNLGTASDIEAFLLILANRGAEVSGNLFIPSIPAPISLEDFINIISDWRRANPNRCPTQADLTRAIETLLSNTPVTTASAEVVLPTTSSVFGIVHEVICNPESLSFVVGGNVPEGCVARNGGTFLEPNTQKDRFEAGMAGLLVEVARGTCARPQSIVGSAITNGTGYFEINRLTSEPHCLILSPETGANSTVMGEGQWWIWAGVGSQTLYYDITPSFLSTGGIATIPYFGWWRANQGGITTRMEMGESEPEFTWLADTSIAEAATLAPPVRFDFLLYRANCNPTGWDGTLANVPAGCEIGEDGQLNPDSEQTPDEPPIEGVFIAVYRNECEVGAPEFVVTTDANGRGNLDAYVRSGGDVFCVVVDASLSANAARLGAGRWEHTSVPKSVSRMLINREDITGTLTFVLRWWSVGGTSAPPAPPTVTPRPAGSSPSGIVPIRPVRDAAACPAGSPCLGVVPVGRPSAPNGAVAVPARPPQGVARLPLPPTPRPTLAPDTAPAQPAQLDADLGTSWRELQIDTSARGVFIGRNPDDNTPNLYLLEDGNIYDLGEGASQAETSASFSPAGSQVAYIGRDEAGTGTLYLLDVETGTFQALFGDSLGIRLLDESLAWSADGASLLFNAEAEDGTQGIYRLNLDATESVPQPLISDARQPAITQDGLLMAFARGTDIVVRFLDTGDEFVVSQALQGSVCEQPFFDANGLDLYFICRTDEEARLYLQGAGELREIPTGTTNLVYAGAGPTSGTLIWDDGSQVTLAAGDGSNAIPFIQVPDLQVSNLRWGG